MDRGIALLAALVVFVVHGASPVQKLGDAEFTLLVSEAVVREGRPALDAHFWPRQPVVVYPGMRAGEVWPRQVQPDGVRRTAATAGGAPDDAGVNLQYIYPHGTSLLAVPFMAAARLFSASTVLPDGRHDAAAEHRLQRIAAPAVVAAAVAALFLLARTLLERQPSLLLALGAAFGTQLWSTASRSLQAHAFSVLLSALALLLLARRTEGRGGARPIALGTLFAWAFFVRPTAVFQIVPLALWFALRERRSIPALAATGALWFAAFLAYSRAVFGTWLPDYYTRGEGFRWDSLGEGLAGTLVSPSRGLFVFVPLALWVLWRAARAVRLPGPRRSLLATLLVAIAVHVLLVASFRNWWGGHSYGPRFTTDLVPLFVLALAIALRERADRGLGRTERVLVALGLAVGVALNGAGALSEGGARWNLVPVPIGQDPGRAFDWSRPQWLCALAPGLLPEPRPER